MSGPLMIYDGSDPAFRAAADLFAAGDAVETARWEAPAVQSFLDAQFDARPFAFLVVAEDRVHVGADAVERALRARGLPAGVAALSGRSYPALAAPIGRLLHGQEPAALAGTVALTDAARERLPAVREGRPIPVEEA